MADALQSWLGMMMNTVTLFSGRRLSESCCFSALVAAVVCCVSSLAVADDILNIGDAPPPLAVSSFVKGEKIDKLDPDKTYVVEFWATWCGPCRASIPHLTELAHHFKDRGVQFIGVDVWEDDVDKVQPFVDKMGEKMDYNVALDSIPDQTKPREGTMAKTWMAAAEEHSIPTAFVIQDGKIAWIGYPMELEKPLAKITSGQWDLAEMSKQRLVDKAKQRKFAAASEWITKPYSAKDYKATLAAIEQVTKEQPELAEMFDGYKFTALCNSGDTDAGLAFGEQMFQQHKDDPGYLNDKFWDVINPDQNRHNGADLRVAQLALKAAQRAVELTKEGEPFYLHTLAAAQFRTGDAATAAATEEKAIHLIKSNYDYDKELADAYLPPFNILLGRYRNAAVKDPGNKEDSDKN